MVLNGERDEEAVIRAFGLANKNNAKLTIVDVLEELPDRIKDYLDIISAEELESLVAKERAEEIQMLLESSESNADIKPEVKTLVGKPHVEIIKEVLRNKHDLVMKTPEGKGDTKEALFGSIDINIMRKCPCPVWMIKFTGSRKFSRILAAVDPEPDNESSKELNNNIMDLAVSIAKLEKSELHIIHVWSLFGEKALRGSRFKKKEDEIKKLIKDAESHHRKLTDELLRNFPLNNIDHTIHMPKGDPAIVIHEVSKKENINLIVMGTVCRTGLPGFIIGNTAESILYKVDCSVLSIKPQGFISPIMP